MSYDLSPTSKFKKDLRRVTKQGVDPARIRKVIDILASGNQLPEKYCDHPLTGRSGRECHILPDLLLIYEVDTDLNSLFLARLGSHSELFG